VFLTLECAASSNSLPIRGLSLESYNQGYPFRGTDQPHDVHLDYRPVRLLDFQILTHKARAGSGRGELIHGYLLSLSHGILGVIDSQAKRMQLSLDRVQTSRTLPRSAAANYSVRNASRGETKLARSAGINDAASADNPNVNTATDITPGLIGFSP